jgi:hypothetical protein
MNSRTAICAAISPRGVAAHAVGDHQQQRVAAIGIGETILVDLALTLRLS